MVVVVVVRLVVVVEVVVDVRLVVEVLVVVRGVVVEVVRVVEPPSAAQLTLTAPALPPPMKPNEVEAPAPSVPFQEAFVTVTVPDEPVAVPPHRDWTLTPDGRVIETVQLVMELPTAVTVTPPWKPPVHEPEVA